MSSILPSPQSLSIARLTFLDEESKLPRIPAEDEYLNTSIGSAGRG